MNRCTYARRAVQSELGQAGPGYDDDVMLNPEVVAEHHVVDVVLSSWHTDPVAVFATQPAHWLEPFLILAGAGGRPRSIPSPSICFQLHLPNAAEPDRVTVAFDWWPRDTEALFTGFTGQFVVAHAAEQLVLSLDGIVSGGASATNERVLSRLVELLGAALSDDHPVVG